LDHAWLLVEPSGAVTKMDELVILSPDGSSAALLGYDGVSLYVDGVEIETARQVLRPTWSPDSSGLFFFAKSSTGKYFDLLYAPAPDFQPMLLAENAFNQYDDPPVWVLP
jgi:hypothetical protein